MKRKDGPRIRRTKKSPKKQLTKVKLQHLILKFLDEREADMTADYQPESETWRQLLASALAEYIIANS
jgi:hypothetical protein